VYSSLMPDCTYDTVLRHRPRTVECLGEEDSNQFDHSPTYQHEQQCTYILAQYLLTKYRSSTLKSVLS
jgi:hypothetical protein